MPSKIGILAPVALVLALSAVAYFGWRSETPAALPASALASASAPSGNNAANARPGAANQEPAVLTAEQKAQKIDQLQKQLVLAQHTYNSYLAGTKYPNESRPISEHPDQIYPNRPIESDHALVKKNGSTDKSVKIRTSQSRVFVGAKETVVFSFTAFDAAGKQLPVFVTQAVARGLSAPGVRQAASVVLNFSDDGQQGDSVANDNIFSATLNPTATGLAQFNGTIRTEVSFNVGDSAGFVLYDIIYTPEVPATWAGGIRDAQEAGSLNFYLKANINKAGRYLVSARVDDANGKPFALLSFNNILAPGPQEIKLPLFGKLIRDQAPAFPLTLRDVDAYLLKEDVDPDRAMMPRLIGNVHTSKKYAPASFSNTEWESEERTRYLTELGKDVTQTQAELNQLKN
ncbi:MAG: hypothetical protein RL748_3802 [Pseudomonadota bacterium]